MFTSNQENSADIFDLVRNVFFYETTEEKDSHFISENCDFKGIFIVIEHKITWQYILERTIWENDDLEAKL